jgi:septal ring factor EnvC (AmiA/AmiB activator)
MEYITRLLLVVSLAISAALTYKLHEANTALTDLKTKVADERAAALDKLQQLETHHKQKLKEVENDTETNLAKLQHSITTADQSNSRLRQQLATFSKRSATTSSASPTCNCEAAESRTVLLAELLGELDGMAGEYAAEADGARIRGLACERAYGSVETDGMDEKR